MVVTDAYRHLTVPGFKQVVVDKKVGIRHIAKDVEEGKMILQTVAELMLLVGRTDVLNNDDMVLVLERLILAIEKAEYRGKVMLVGPLPEARDRPWFCRDLLEAHRIMGRRLRNLPNWHMCHAGAVLMDDRGIIPQLMDHNSLTLDGRHELLLCL